MLDSCTVLVENHSSELRSVKTVHGLSCVVECEGKRILFDCGPDETLLYNAALMGVNLSDIDCVVLSHSHYDHSGGYPFYLKEHHCSSLVVGADFFTPKYAYDGEIYTYLGCGFDRSLLEKHGVEEVPVTGAMRLAGSLYAFSGFSSHYDFETVPSRFVKGDTAAGWKPDNFSDEVVLVKDNGESLTLLVGCAHIGILSIVKEVENYFGKKVETVLGGVHLSHNSDEYVDRVIDLLIAGGLKRGAFSHCSGDAVIRKCTDDDRIRFSRLFTGNVMVL